MRLKVIAALAAVTLSLSACQTANNANLAAQVDAACTRAKPIVASVQVLYDAGELSAKSRKTFQSAKAAMESVCSAPPADYASALLALTVTYVQVKQLMKETK
jgi:hypothetical protein